MISEGRDLCQGGLSPRRLPVRQRAGGVHPTGMHSCILNESVPICHTHDFIRFSRKSTVAGHRTLMCVLGSELVRSGSTWEMLFSSPDMTSSPEQQNITIVVFINLVKISLEHF